jgi:hypothetical protein
MTLQQDIETWDEKSADDITAIYERHCTIETFIIDTMSALDTSELQNGATWLLKKHLESGVTIPPETVSALYHNAPILEKWQSKLHVLQCIPLMSITTTDKLSVESFLRTCLNDPNKFVRAWAYSGFVELAVRFKGYEIETKKLITYAMKEEASSVTARLRNVIKTYNFQ